ncbi:hypothetical protein BCR32DRAFT_265503 [Anaeromyces robustus]|uniref:Uncharacterized protein n=1 Tax=Anaeromyces robustus TaxID=1754192 RepID=A0A1Y1XIS2_9FUNG|nr:hypothetical protein BCR32DRAFT_265503 [Anaeromyces robustus]|eukprot:ORX85658.1 hypothetical protein BCR32DRAFT_265503 [Anaeromyces robustus]
MDIDNLKNLLINLLSLLKKTENIELEENNVDLEKATLQDVIEQIHSLLWLNSNLFSNQASKEIEEAFNNLITYYPQEISEKESFMMRCTYLLTDISNKYKSNNNEEKNEVKEDITSDDDLFSKIFINKFSNGFGKELNDIQQEEQLSINKMNFLVKNIQDVKEIYKDEKKYWLLNAKK